MFYIPSIPKWHGVHVLIVHFPIALLTIVPLLILLAAIIKPARRGLAISAFVVLILGTFTAWLATATGGPAAHASLAQFPESQHAQLHAAIHHHAELGKWTRNFFTGLCALFFLMLLVPLFKKLSGKTCVAGLLIFFVLCLPGIFFLIDTGDAGAMLVHKYGLKAEAFPESATLNTGQYTAAKFKEEHEHKASSAATAPSATAPSHNDGD